MSDHQDAWTNEPGQDYLFYRVEGSDRATVSAAFFRQAEHLHLALPAGMAVADDGLTRRVDAEPA